MSRCMCGADDCSACFPQNFHGGIYLDPDDERDLAEIMADIDQAQEDAQVSAYEERQARMSEECESGRYDP